MAEEFQAAICGGGGGTWWNIPTKTMFSGCNSPLYSTTIADMGSFGWGNDMVATDDIIIKPRSCYNSDNSGTNNNSSILIDSTLGFGLSSSDNWNQSLLRSNNQEFPMDSTYECPPTLLFDTDPQQQSVFNNNNQSINYMSCSSLSSSPSWPKLAPPLTTKQQQQPPVGTGTLQFSNNTSFWNASATGNILPSLYEEKPNCPTLTTKTNIEEVRKNSNSKKASNETPLKRPRLETPSPLPTFKVRKEKLGDRITALQQLVSPFGKTDTASVLHEAIEYIKFLHDQVNVLSTPYMKQAAASIQQSTDKLKDHQEGPKQDLRSRGLCLVPVSSTFPVANETPADFWTPTFGGTFR
ncbi:transcription factor bHLH112 [Gossypium raimondii]|uniref:BHLH domain-containing protein n=2 Tax=Gossypium raimondii TaxID=29730 RepID=A0A0D2RFK5_GOSRA|nr:transcription factor bHLH112 [Gossypium raimondii]KJB69372.1 hypothetical protein B456_011G020100 [Gossypium raimondii]